jgi:hypothetical protein
LFRARGTRLARTLNQAAFQGTGFESRLSTTFAWSPDHPIGRMICFIPDKS